MILKQIVKWETPQALYCVKDEEQRRRTNRNERKKKWKHTCYPSGPHCAHLSHPWPHCDGWSWALLPWNLVVTVRTKSQAIWGKSMISNRSHIRFDWEISKWKSHEFLMGLNRFRTCSNPFGQNRKRQNPEPDLWSGSAIFKNLGPDHRSSLWWFRFEPNFGTELWQH